jgi:putative NADH-flavin reductase
MKIALIGATGYTGARIREEALNRGHLVTAIVRNANVLPEHPRLTPLTLDVTDSKALAQVIADHDVVISAFNPGKDETEKGAAAIIEAVKSNGRMRLLVVGGAGSLETAPGKRLVDQPDFPAQWKAGALKTAAFLDALTHEPNLNWTFVSPAAQLSPGPRTGSYRIGADQLLTDSKGESRISVEDFAVAMIDSVEKSTFLRQRFSVAY